MKMPSAGRFSLLGVMVASMSVFSAAVDTVTVTEGGVAFTVVLFEDTHGLKFRQNGTRSFYTFESATKVTSMQVGTETYNITYDTSDNLESVTLAPSTRRALSQEENTATEVEGRRLDFEDCTACEDTWDALCAGVSSVCDLVGYGSPLSTAAAASVDTTCETFGSACSRYDASEACQGQCTEAGVDNNCTIRGYRYCSNKCLDPAREEYKCTFSGDTTLVFTGCTLTDDDVPFFQACFEEFGKTNIQELLLDANKLRSIPEGTFAGLSELTILDLYRNKLVTLPEGVFDGLTKLEDLDLTFNDLVSLPEGVFSWLESLLKLRLSVNELTPEGLPIGLFSGTPLLQELDLTRNNLRGIASLVGLFDGLTELIDLGLGECRLQTVPEGLFVGLTKLERLCLYFNWLGNLPDGAFSGLTGLRTLVISSTGVTSVGSSLSGLTELRTLFLEFNDLLLTEDSFSGLSNLERLDLEACGVTTLPAGVLSPLVNLATLDLADNGLTNIGSSLSGLTELRTLNLRDNDLLLTEDTFSGLVNLESLDIFSTGLASLPEGFASRLPALLSLNLGSNDLLLTEDSFSGLGNLETLTLSGNELSSLPEGLFSALTALITLTLGGNPLLLTEDIFSGLVNLETLNLANSGLTTLPAGLFSPLVNVATLVVSRNSDIQCIPPSTATDIVSPYADLPDGACECTPVEVVFCDDGLTCQSGMDGYTCVAE